MSNSLIFGFVKIRKIQFVCVSNMFDHQMGLPTRLKAVSEFLPTCLMEFYFAAVDLITAVNNQNIFTLMYIGVVCFNAQF